MMDLTISNFQIKINTRKLIGENNGIYKKKSKLIII